MRREDEGRSCKLKLERRTGDPAFRPNEYSFYRRKKRQRVLSQVGRKLSPSVPVLVGRGVRSAPGLRLLSRPRFRSSCGRAVVRVSAWVRWWVEMVVRFVCVIRVPVCARAPRVLEITHRHTFTCVSRLPAPPYVFILLYNGFASALVSATAPPLYLRAPRGWRPPAIPKGRAIRRGPRAACVNQNWFHDSTA